MGMGASLWHTYMLNDPNSLITAATPLQMVSNKGAAIQQQLYFSAWLAMHAEHEK